MDAAPMRQRPRDAARMRQRPGVLALVGFVALVAWKVPPVVVVAAGAILGALVLP